MRNLIHLCAIGDRASEHACAPFPSHRRAEHFLSLRRSPSALGVEALAQSVDNDALDMDVWATKPMNPADLGSGPPPVDWLHFFSGAWRMTRRIDDRRGGRRGHAEGEAVLAAHADSEACLICRETLSIDYAGRRWPGYQQTLWRFESECGPRLYFSDGRFVCDMAFAHRSGQWRAALTHSCGDDIYQGDASIVDKDAWRLIWRVFGPRKDYTLDTEFRRISERV